jgi:hypothetical protein
MAYPFRQMTTRELKKRSQDNRLRERDQKTDPEARQTHGLKIKSQEEICKN